MFSFFGGGSKRREEASELPPVPPARSDDEFVLVGPGPSPPPPLRAAPAPPAPPHYLQGVPFALSKELQMSSNKDAFATQIGDLLAFSTRRLQLDRLAYDFALERSVLRECGDAA